MMQTRLRFSENFDENHFYEINESAKSVYVFHISAAASLFKTK